MQGRLVDIKAGKLTYGQRIELGEIFQNEKLSEAKKFKAALKCMLGEKYAVKWQWEEVKIFEKIIEGVQFWAEREKSMLHYEPTADELAAGYKQLGERLGVMSTVMTLAQKFGKDPDEILEWEYGKVFGLLYADLEQYKFGKRYQAVLDAKYKTPKRPWSK